MSIPCNNRNAAYQATKLLLDKKHRKIGMIAGSVSPPYDGMSSWLIRMHYLNMVFPIIPLLSFSFILSDALYIPPDHLSGRYP